MHRAFLVTLVAIGLCHVESVSILNWIWNKQSDESTVLVADGVPLISIPYEAMTDDEKFLQEAAKFTEIQVSSPLDTCQHKVVMKIKTSCSDMTEEELAKLSVNLLNCQSAVEGRKMFPCTEEMSLRQCTTDMDADMWNAYHLMSNRARAVCYAARNAQFRALTELTVNKLMHTAHSQIKAMSSLKENQERLEAQTVEALSSLTDGNKVLLKQQEYLKDAQISAHNLVSSNLRELNNEKALIRSGHALIASMTEEIRNKLEKAREDLMDQSVKRSENHKEVLADLMNMQQQAQVMWDKIESSTNRIISQNRRAATQYEHTLEKLGQINQTIHYLLDITDTMRTEVDRKLGWLTDYIDGTGEQLQRAYRTSLHILYLLVAMVVAAFLQAPFLTRATIMGIIPLNLASYLKHGADACLDFVSITALILLITTMHYVMIGIQCLIGSKKNSNIRIGTANSFDNNGISNGHTCQPTTKSNHTSVSKAPLRTRMGNSIFGVWNAIVRQINFCKDKIGTCASTISSWSQGNEIPQEEMSCSYLPSKKAREDLVTDYARKLPNLSDDVVDTETYSILSAGGDKFDNTEDLFDANDLKNRIRRRDNSISSTYNYPRSPSRSGTPSAFSSPKAQCSALTRTGRQCRLYAGHGQNFCYRHSQGSSFMGD